MGYSLWGHKESDMTELLTFSLYIYIKMFIHTHTHTYML